MDAETRWLLFLPQLPSSPSSLRVLTWRRLRAIGAVSIQNGVWVLPQTDDNLRFVGELLADVQPQGGNGMLLSATTLDTAQHHVIIAQFQSDRAQEYTEFCQRCTEFEAEIASETERQKFTFAELEENEQDLHKLAGWLQKIQTRDAFGSPQARSAIAAFGRCRKALQAFAEKVYVREGLAPDERDPDVETPSA